MNEIIQQILVKINLQNVLLVNILMVLLKHAVIVVSLLRVAYYVLVVLIVHNAIHS